MSDWVIYLFLIIAILVIIGFFNNRSEAIAEEIRQTKVIDELPITKSDVNKLFKKRKTKKPARKNKYHYSTKAIDFDSFDEISPLKIMGYTVGVNGLNAYEREKVLNLALFGNFQRYMPEQINYDLRWGIPGSRTRFKLVHDHIRRVKNLRNNRRNMSQAVRDWSNDLNFIRTQQNQIYRFRFTSPK